MGKETPYFKHEALASIDTKLVNLLTAEKIRGYGVYWLLLETLRLKPGFKIAISQVGSLAHRFGTQHCVVKRVIENYDLFVEEDGYFYSPGLSRRLQVLADHSAGNLEKRCPGELAKPLVCSEVKAVPARVLDKTRQEERNNSLTRESVKRVLSMEESVSLLPSEQIWCEDMARMSGRGSGFFTDLPLLLPSFVAFLRLRGEEYSVCSLSDAKRRFLYWMKSDDGKQALRKLSAAAAAATAESNPAKTPPNRFETLLDGHRTYMGRPIPDDAPPRPGSMAVWDEYGKKWIV